MDSDDDFSLYDATDSGNESPEEEGEEEEDMQDEVDDFGIDMDPEPGGSHAQKIEDEYPFEVLSTEKIVSNMVESIKEVSQVVQDQIPTTTVGIIYLFLKFPSLPQFDKFHQVRILLNHFKWDKERLMERLYSDDQEAMFVEAQVRKEVNNFLRPKYGKRPNILLNSCFKVISPFKKKPEQKKKTMRPTEECDICCLSLPKAMMRGMCVYCSTFLCG